MNSQANSQKRSFLKSSEEPALTKYLCAERKRVLAETKLQTQQLAIIPLNKTNMVLRPKRKGPTMITEGTILSMETVGGAVSCKIKTPNNQIVYASRDNVSSVMVQAFERSLVKVEMDTHGPTRRRNSKPIPPQSPRPSQSRQRNTHTRQQKQQKQEKPHQENTVALLKEEEKPEEETVKPDRKKSFLIEEQKASQKDPGLTVLPNLPEANPSLFDLSWFDGLLDKVRLTVREEVQSLSRNQSTDVEQFRSTIREEVRSLNKTDVTEIDKLQNKLSLLEREYISLSTKAKKTEVDLASANKMTESLQQEIASQRETIRQLADFDNEAEFQMEIASFEVLVRSLRGKKVLLKNCLRLIEFLQDGLPAIGAYSPSVHKRNLTTLVYSAQRILNLLPTELSEKKLQEKLKAAIERVHPDRFPGLKSEQLTKLREKFEGSYTFLNHADVRKYQEDCLHRDRQLQLTG